MKTYEIVAKIIASLQSDLENWQLFIPRAPYAGRQKEFHYKGTIFVYRGGQCVDFKERIGFSEGEQQEIGHAIGVVIEKILFDSIGADSNYEDWEQQGRRLNNKRTGASIVIDAETYGNDFLLPGEAVVELLEEERVSELRVAYKNYLYEMFLHFMESDFEGWENNYKRWHYKPNGLTMHSAYLNWKEKDRFVIANNYSWPGRYFNRSRTEELQRIINSKRQSAAAGVFA